MSITFVMFENELMCILADDPIIVFNFSLFPLVGAVPGYVTLQQHHPVLFITEMVRENPIWLVRSYK